jgi:basic amino acid/polyamine antiporter, APA family
MSKVRRSLGLGSLTFYGVGLILGAGIYSILGEAAGVAGEALWLSFLLRSLATLLTGGPYAGDAVGAVWSWMCASLA